MNILSLIHSVEAFLYEIVLWIIFIPKTFIKAVFFPKWCQNYPVKEWKKEASERWEGYVSPMIFWLVICVIPYLIAINFISSDILGNSLQNTLSLKEKMIYLPSETKFLFISIFLATYPLGFSIGVLKYRRESLSKKNMQRIFYTQCLCFAPAFLFLLPFVFMYIASGGPLTVQAPKALQIAYLISPNAFFWWLFFAETNILRQELRTGWLKSMGLFFIFLIVSLLIMFAMEAILLIGVFIPWK